MKARITEPLQCFDQGKIDDHAATLVFRIPECRLNGIKLVSITPHLSNIQSQVGSVDSLVKQLDFISGNSQLLIDVHPTLGSCGRCQGDGRGFMQQFPDLSQPRIVWPKIMPPLTHTMSFINSQKFDLTTCQHIKKLRLPKSFRVTYSKRYFPGQPLRIEPALLAVQ